MDDIEKLRVLIPHWIEHNDEHAREFHQWAESAGDAAPELIAASRTMQQVNQNLSIALEKLGGAHPHPHGH